MLSNYDKKVILEYAKRYKAKEVILFGSCIHKNNAKDIDLGIKGIKSNLFFKFYGELLLRLSKRIDIVDLTKDNLFNKIIKEEGIKIYG